jgi:predicted transcriptional regulator
MKTIPLKPERQAELEEFARRRGKTPAEALDEALAAYLEWESQDFEEAVRGIQQGYDDVKAGRTRSADEFLADIRRKHDISR